MGSLPRPDEPPATRLLVTKHRKGKPSPLEGYQWIQDDPTIDANATAVLQAVWRHANSRTGWCWPSVVKIVEKTKLSKATVNRTIRALSRSGHLLRGDAMGRAAMRAIAWPRFVYVYESDPVDPTEPENEVSP